MTLLEDLLEEARARGAERTIADVRIGLGYTAVQLDNGSVGLAYTFRENAGHGCTVFQGRRPIASAAVRDIVGYITSSDMLERTVGLAAANALFNTDDPAGACAGWSCHGGDLLDVLELSADDRVGMVGFFGPLAPVIRQRAAELVIFEEHMDRADSLVPGARAAELLPTCTVAIITATTIINNSFEKIAAAASACRAIAVLGPSTPLVPALFRDYGVTHLSGVVAENPRQIMQVVSEAGGTRFFMKWCKKINVIKTS
ncbi:MAG: hypothetical protein FJ119_08435 [Deltaproteobacteria bacterium]|nr:hypothetical protein [Deltaproteobacteria bacterium]